MTETKLINDKNEDFRSNHINADFLLKLSIKSKKIPLYFYNGIFLNLKTRK